MNIPKIPTNSLTEEIKEIVSLCQQLEPKYGANASWFESPATEEEIKQWELQNNISIPEAYKEWLRFSGDSQILNTLARFYGVKMIGEYNQYVAEDLVVIGELIGDGEMLCFSRRSQNIFRYDHGKAKEITNFKEWLNNFLIRMLREETY